MWVNDNLPTDEERERVITPVMFDVVGTANPDLVEPRNQRATDFYAQQMNLADLGSYKRDVWELTVIENKKEQSNREKLRMQDIENRLYKFNVPSFYVVPEIVELIQELAAMGTRKEIPQQRKLSLIPAYKS